MAKPGDNASPQPNRRSCDPTMDGQRQRTLFTELMMQAPYQPATNYWRAIEIEQVIHYGLPSGCGLDLGCGDGLVAATIMSRIGARDLVGVDIDPKETAMATGRNIYREVLSAPSSKLPFSDSSFQFVFSNSVLEHIADINQTLAEVARVLCPGGRFIFTVPGPDFHACLRAPRFGARDAYLCATDARCAHLRYWDPRQWAAALAETGLDLLHQHEYLSQAQVRRWERIARYTSGILYRLTRGRKQPIEMQRQWGLRSIRLRLPRSLSSAMAAVIDWRAPNHTPLHGCLLIEAQKLS